jgi:protein-tyrosine-phosphatase
MLLTMPLFLLASGWWQHARTRRIAGVRVPFPGPETAKSAFYMSLIVATTTLNFTFAGISILFVLVLERLETLILAPTMDLIRRRKIHLYSRIALGLCALAAIITLTDADNYRLSLFAAFSILTYLAGYTGRFDLMSRHAKTGRPIDRRYFVEEHMTTPVLLTLWLAGLALINQGPAMHAIRDGFTSFLTTPAGLWAMGIGVCYEGLFIFTSLIFIDRRGFAFGMPVHVCASLLAGVAASFVLRAIYGTAAPSTAQLVAATCVSGAALVLSYPALRRLLRPTPATAALARLVLFVCGTNTCRSAMAAAIARAELARGNGQADGWRVGSAGVNVAAPGAPMAVEAQAALRELGVAVNGHQAQSLTRELCQQSEAIYCMTTAQRDAVLDLAPEAAGKVFSLDPDGDLPDPHGQPAEAYQSLSQRLQGLVRQRLPVLATTSG